MTHFHVTEGSQGGYLSDSSARLGTLRESDNYAAGLVRELEDNAIDAEERITVEEWTDIIDIGYPDRSHDLGRVIERVECDDDDCEAAGAA